jgi:hypothetical protein
MLAVIASPIMKSFIFSKEKKRREEKEKISEISLARF